MSDASTPLRDTAFMRAILDLAIPPSGDGKLPGAGSLDLCSDVAGALEADAMLGPIVQAGLRAVHDAALARDPGGLTRLSQQARLEVVEAQLGPHPLLMIGVVRYLYPAYYRHPRVLDALGEPARPPFPEGYEIEATDAGLLEKLRSRRGA